MLSYPSIENLYVRDDETHKLVVGVAKRPDFLQVDRWHVTEKIDGMNIRLILTWDNGYPHVDIRGRTDKANLPGDFADSAFGDDGSPYWSQDSLANKLASGLSDITGDGDGSGIGELAMIVFGEGYGPGIQKGGGDYASHKSFRAFDVATFRVTNGDEYSKPLWRTWDDVVTVAAQLDIDTAPVLAVDASTAEVEELVRSMLTSDVSAAEGTGNAVPEGVIARTDPYLFDFRGHRVMFKLKGHDLPS